MLYTWLGGGRYIANAYFVHCPLHARLCVIAIFQPCCWTYHHHHHHAAPQVPLGLEGFHEGVVDVVGRRALTFGGAKGTEVQEGPVPPELEQEVEARRTELVERVAEVCVYTLALRATGGRGGRGGRRQGRRCWMHV